MREVGAPVPVARQPLFLDAQKDLLRLIGEEAQKFVFQGAVAARLPRQMHKIDDGGLRARVGLWLFQTKSLFHNSVS